jgi:hypothetical protein
MQRLDMAGLPPLFSSSQPFQQFQQRAPIFFCASFLCSLYNPQVPGNSTKGNARPVSHRHICTIIEGKSLGQRLHCKLEPKLGQQTQSLKRQLYAAPHYATLTPDTLPLLTIHSVAITYINSSPWILSEEKKEGGLHRQTAEWPGRSE